MPQLIQAKLRLLTRTGWRNRDNGDFRRWDDLMRHLQANHGCRARRGGDLLERDMMRPPLLRNFGWQIAHVLAKDWYANPDDVVQRLLRLVASAD